VPPPLRRAKTLSKHYWQTTGTDPGDRILGMTLMRTSRPFLQCGHRCTSKLQMRLNRSSMVSCGFMIILPASFTIYRIFCCFDEGQLIVLFNGFQKKTQKTPKREIFNYPR
jgi:hypothetical protein